ncbi:MAG: Stk1 family PASTA domain-containing Ser/Thr kinase [Actinomycetota bacterium]
MSDRVGEIIDGRYQITSLISRGGMATVYSAMDSRLDRTVAIKIMHEHLAQDEEFVSRFIREAKAAAALSHPNLVQVYDQGWNQGGIPAVFLVMEYIPGATLRDHLFAVGQLGAKESLEIIEQVLSALVYAHRAGIIHRDIKPENIMITADGRAKLGDFGLARAVSTGNTLTADANVLMGTVAYLAPEQVQRGIADAKSDIYSLGIVLFEMLTGKKPYEGDSPIQIAYRHVHDRVPAPSTLVPAITKDLDLLVLRATAPDPGLRYQNVSEFQESIRKSLLLLDPDEQQLSLPLGIPEELRRASKYSSKEPRKNVRKVSPESERKSAERKTEMTNPKVSNTAEIRRRSSKRVRRNRFIAVAIAALIGIASWYQLFGPGSQSAIPSVVGATKKEAVATMATLGVKVKVTKNTFDELVPKGKIISMAPPAGSRLGEGESISVIISKGPERYSIPNLKGKSVSQATVALANEKLLIGKTEEAFSAIIPKGQIISVSPEPGTLVKKNSEVNLVVSKGEELISLTSYIGKSSEQALNELTDAGFEVTQKDTFSDSYPIGIVIAQKPETPELVKGGKVTLTVSKGPEKIKVPSGVLKLDEGKAVKLLEDYGFTVKVLKPAKTPKGKKLTVIKVTPNEGALVKPNSEITIELK